MKERDKVINFIETENAFAVMGQFRKMGIIDKADMEKAMSMSREEWLQFMKEKAGVAD